MLPPVRVRTAGDEPVPVVDGVHAAIGVDALRVDGGLRFVVEVWFGQGESAEGFEGGGP